MALSGNFTTSGYTDSKGKKRVWKFSWTATQDIGSNTSTINWKIEATGGYYSWYKAYGITLKINGSEVYKKSGSWEQYAGTLKTGTTTVTHNDDGTLTLTASISGGIYYNNSNAKGSGTWGLDTIPRASLPSVNSTPNSVVSVNIGDKLTIYTNKKANFTHKVTAKFGTKSVTVTESCVDSVVWNGFTLDAFAGQIKDSVSGTLTISVDTMNGTTKIGTATTTVTANLPTDVKPSLSVNITNTNNTFSAYARYISGVKVKPTATAPYSATIKSINISVTDMSDKLATSGTEYTFDVFKTTGTKTVRVTATDSRGRAATWSTTINVVNYSTPTATVSASRGNGTTVSNFVANDTGTKAKISIVGSVFNITGNTLTPSLKYRIAGGTTWTNVSVSASGMSINTSALISVDDTKAYDIQFTVTDKSGLNSVALMTLSNGFATLDFKAGGDGIAFGKTANQAGFDCSMIMRILKGAYLQSESAGGYGSANWYYNNSGTQVSKCTAYAASDGFHLKAQSGTGFLEGTWSGTLSDMRMKRDIEPIAQEMVKAVGEVPFYQFRMSAPGYDHDVLYVGILAQDLKDAFLRHGVDQKMLVLGTIRLNPDSDEEYYCVEYTHFLLLRLLYDEIKIEDFNKRLMEIENKISLL